MVGYSHRCIPSSRVVPEERKRQSPPHGYVPSEKGPVTPSAAKGRDAGNVAKPEKSPPPERGLHRPARDLRRGRPRVEDREKTLAATRPWEAAGVSRRTWFRRQKEGKAK